ncbi:uncharacterized protein [Asterias amurensis]|uniref:uncharacterized protein n=1 Tax=Asterias amurensis TaxID=7602 RepID=UPI003AB6CC55
MAAPSNNNKCPSKSAKSPQTKQCNRGKVWSDVELGTFLDIWASQEIQNKLDGTVRNKAVFLDLTAMMNERGFTRTSKELQNKIKNLKRDYKKTIDHNKRSGVNLKTLPHMDKLDNIIGGRQRVEPLFVFQSGRSDKAETEAGDEQWEGEFQDLVDDYYNDEGKAYQDGRLLAEENTLQEESIESGTVSDDVEETDGDDPEGSLSSPNASLGSLASKESYRQAAKRLLSRKCKRKHLQLLGASQQGGQVETIDGSNGPILTVDPFKGIIFLQDRAAESTNSDEHPKRRRKWTRQYTCTSKSGATNGSCSVIPSSSLEEPSACSSSTELSPSGHQKGEIVFVAGQHMCGQIYKVRGLELEVMIGEIYINDQSAMCWPVVAQDVNTSISVSLPLSHLLGEKKNITGMAKTKSKQVLREAFTQTRVNLGNASFRNAFRVAQLTNAIIKEIKSAFWSTTRQRNFDLGLISPEIDCEVFSISLPDSPAAEYSYKKDNLGNLDNILGQGWDTSQNEGVTRYVTSLRLEMNRDLTLSGSVHVADFDSLIPSVNYRQILRQHMFLCKNVI